MRSVPSNGLEMFSASTAIMTQSKKKAGNRRGTGPANRFSQLLNEELRAAQSRRCLTLRALEELTGVSRNRLSLTLNLGSSPLNTNEFEVICRALELNPAEVCFRAEVALQKELAAETSSVSDKESA
nr:MAG TPA: Regulatory protein-modification, helix-turn-helix, transcriptional regulator, DNA [Caudoviricetes sp.]